jgi:exodeoxyribonuclease V beta subunit
MFEQKLAYEASAGSGKTFNLVVRYLSLLFMGASPSKVLALTFTNKAATEMQERIVETLSELEKRDELDVIAKVTNQTKIEILSQKKEVLHKFLNADLKIMTLDKFFAKILRKFSLHMGLMPNFTTFASQHEQKLFERFLDEVSVKMQEDTLIDLSLMMDKRVSDIFVLLQELYSKLSEIKQLSFTPLSHFEYEKKVMASHEKIASHILTCKDASSTVKDAVDSKNIQELLKKSWLSRESLDYSTFKKCYQSFLDEYLQEIKENITLYMQAKEQSFFHSLLLLLDAYVQAKKGLAKELGELGFDDIATFVHELLTQRIESEFLYFRLDAKIEHILLDEFQDTSVLQYEILRPLIKEVISGHGLHENGSFFFVGDVKQSIYRFRGGVSALFDFVKHDNGVKVESLKVNYRSQKEVVNFVNSLFKSRIAGYQEQSVRESAQGGYVEVIHSDELLQNAHEIVQNLLNLGANIDEIAILCMTNSDGMEVESYLKEQNIEVVTETTTKIINQKIIQALIEYLKYIRFDEEIYRHNFFALISQELSPIYKPDLNRLSLKEIVHDVINRYGLYRGEFHVLRFMEMLGGYKDIEQFLFEYERDDMSAAASDLRGVRVLTVHKSKGLEYEHVVVMDRLKKAPVSRAPIIYEYEGITLENIYLRMKERDELDEVYANALQKEKNLSEQDNLNALYVAFTRARNSLFIIAKEKGSVFEQLDLHEISSGTLHVNPLEKKQEPEYVALNYQKLYYGTQSNILEVAKKEDDSKAITFGLALHYYLEMMQEFTQENAIQGFQAMLNRYGMLLDDEEIADIQNRIAQLLENKRFLELCNGECLREQGMLVDGELRFMDLLVERDDGSFNVIDYKSSEYINENHIQQVRGYIKAVKRITSEEVRGYLCYIRRDEVVIRQVL